VIRIGTCGWSYDHWQPELYAPGLLAADRLARYAAAFPTAELNSSFCRWAPASGIPQLAAQAARGVPAAGQGTPGPGSRAPAVCAGDLDQRIWTG
jgi:hypothetical protein